MTSKFDLSPMDIALQNERQEVVEILQESLVSPSALSNAVASIYSPSHTASSAPREPPVTITVGPKVLRTFPVKKNRPHTEVRVTILIVPCRNQIRYVSSVICALQLF